MKPHWFFLVAIILVAAGCNRKSTDSTRELERIAGSWKGGPVSDRHRPPSEIRLFSWRPDSSLALSMIYEIGPRSRVWPLDIDVTVRDRNIVWDDHEALLSANGDTMTFSEEDRGGRSLWQFVRERPADSLMAQLHACSGEAYVYRPPDHLDDGWLCADVATTGIDKAKIVAFSEQIARGKHDDIHSFLIVKDGRLVVEEYFAANGERYGPFITMLFRGRVHHLASTTKSVTSTLVGIAIDQGCINGVEAPIYHYLPAYASLFSEDKKRVRISHMLTMTPGFQWRQFNVGDAGNDGMQMWRTDDVIRFVLQKPLEAEPGEEFNYSNGTPTVTGAIIRNAVGMGVAEFAESVLFRPLQISEYLWTSYPDGSVETDGGLALRPRDLAKIGQLFLDGGVWNGRRIVSEHWILESTKERLRFGRFNRWGYGYHWMQAVSRIGDRVIHSWFVPGDGNQILAVFPELHMVVVFTAGNYGIDPKGAYYSLFDDFILPAVVPES